MYNVVHNLHVSESCSFTCCGEYINLKSKIGSQPNETKRKGIIVNKISSQPIQNVGLPLLELIGITSMQITESNFVARDHFISNKVSGDRPIISEIWSGFHDRFCTCGKSERTYGRRELDFHRLGRSSVDEQILKEMGSIDKQRTMIVEIWTLLCMQPSGPRNCAGPLSTNGCGNIFYVETDVILNGEERLIYRNSHNKDVILCSVIVDWGNNGWRVGAYSILEGSQDVGCRVFSRVQSINSLEKI